MVNSQSARLPLFAIAWVVILGACATTKIESTLGPEATARPVERVLVLFPLRPTEARELVETTFADESTAGTTFIPSYPYFSQDKEYSGAEISEILRKNEIDALLRLSVTHQGYKKSYMPYSGSQLDNPNAGFEMELINVEDGAVLWSSTATTQGNALADGDDLLRSIARKTVDQLSKDGLIY